MQARQRSLETAVFRPSKARSVSESSRWRCVCPPRCSSAAPATARPSALGSEAQAAPQGPGPTSQKQPRTVPSLQRSYPCPPGVREAPSGCRPPLCLGCLGGAGVWEDWQGGRPRAPGPGWAPGGTACSRGSAMAAAAGFQVPAARRRPGAGSSSQGPRRPQRPCSRRGTVSGTPHTGASSGAARWGGPAH